jgi:hypothetical protein
MSRHFASVLEACHTHANTHHHHHHHQNHHLASSSSSLPLASPSVGPITRVPPSSPLVVRAAARPPRPPARYMIYSHIGRIFVFPFCRHGAAFKVSKHLPPFPPSPLPPFPPSDIFQGLVYPFRAYCLPVNLFLLPIVFVELSLTVITTIARGIFLNS